ncbi:unnamed protein product, partial [Dibothriocephalus latus]
WFPKYRATIVGIIAAGFGCGALIFTPIQTFIINPNSLTDLTDPSIMARVPDAFLILGGVMLGLQIIGFIICRERKVVDTEEAVDQSASENDSKINQDEEYANAANSVKLVQKSYTLKEALQTIDFYLLWFIFFCNVYGGDVCLGDRYLSIIATLSSAFNALGRVLWGLIVDHFSFKCPYGVLTFIWAVLFATFPAIGISSSSSSASAGANVTSPCANVTVPSALPYIYPVWVFSLFFLLAGHFVISPGAAGRIFGPENMATIYGLIFFATAPSSLGLAAIISQFQIAGKWIEVYESAAALCLISFTLSLFLKDKSGTCARASDICARACNVCRPIADEDEEKADGKYDADYFTDVPEI